MRSLTLFMFLIAAHAGATVAFAKSPAGSPFKGRLHVIPGLIEAEDFDEGAEGVAFHEADTQTSHAPGQAYRKSPVDVEVARGGKVMIGIVKEGEWLAYTAEVKRAGIYDVEVSVSHWGKPAAFRIEVDGVDKTGPIEPPNTGDWNKFGTAKKRGVTLAKGIHTIRLVNAKGDDLLNWDSFAFVPAREEK